MTQTSVSINSLEDSLQLYKTGCYYSIASRINKLIVFKKLLKCPVYITKHSVCVHSFTDSYLKKVQNETKEYQSVIFRIDKIIEQFSKIKRNEMTLEEISDLTKDVDYFEEKYRNYITYHNNFEKQVRQTIKINSKQKHVSVTEKQSIESSSKTEGSGLTWTKFLTCFNLIVSGIIMLAIRINHVNVNPDPEILMTILGIILGSIGLFVGILVGGTTVAIVGAILGGGIGAGIGYGLAYLWQFFINEISGAIVFVFLITGIGFILGKRFDRKR